MKSLFEQNGGTFSVVGDYLLPDLKLPKHEIVFIGRYGRLHKEYLKKHKNSVYTELLLAGKLNAYLAEIDTQSRDMLELLMKQMAKKQCITEELKTQNQMTWVRAMNNIKSYAEEIVLSTIIFSIY